MNNKAVIDVLSKSLLDESLQVRKSAVIALLKIGTDDSLTALKGIKDDESEEIRELISKSLKKINSESKIEVPSWNEYSANLDSATTEQKKFYKYWSSEIRAKNFIDLEENLSYIFAYLYSLIYDFIENEDINDLFVSFDLIMEGYSTHSTIKKNIIRWKSDAYLFLEDYENSLKTLNEIGFSSYDLQNYGILKKDSLINGNVIINLNPNGFTDFGKRNKEEISRTVDEYLEDFKIKHGKNIARYFLEDFNLEKLTKTDLKNLKSFFDNNEDFYEASENYTSYQQNIDYYFPNLGYFELKNLSKKDLKRLKDNLNEKQYLEVVSGNSEFFLCSEIVDVSTLNKDKLKKWNSILVKSEFLKLKKTHDSYISENNNFGVYSETITLDMRKILEKYTLKNIDQLEYILGNSFQDFKSNFVFFLEFKKNEEINAIKRVLVNRIFGGVPNILRIHDHTIKLPYIVSNALENELKRITRESENRYREEKGIPRIGEGWVSETELYYKIKEAFPNEKIIHHGRPSWLGQQHLDIYFPEKNIGIEYQGLQHDKPIDFFGGQEAFQDNQKRDKLKKRLCKNYNCHLIYVYPEYNFKDVKTEIQKHINSFSQ